MLQLRRYRSWKTLSSHIWDEGARIEHVMLKFKKLDIANPFHQYSNSFEKHSGREKFRLGAFPVGIANWSSTPFRTSNCIVLKVVALM